MTKTINKNTKLYAGDKFAITSTDGRKFRLVIDIDEHPEDPRSWDNIGTMLCCNNDYRLGDCNSNEETEEQLAAICRKYGKSDEEIDEMTFGDEIRFILDQDNICGLPLWLYDHSGISISTGVVDSWDSSFVGLIFVEKDFYLAQICLKDEEGWKEKAKKTLEREIEVYDAYLTGEVFSYTLYEPITVTKTNCKGEVISTYTDWEDEVFDSLFGLYDLTLETVESNLPIEIAEIEEID